MINSETLAIAKGVTPPKELIDFFRDNDGFFIAIHLSPDGDALGAAGALGMALEKMGKRAVLACRDSVPEQYSFLPGAERFLTFNDIITRNIDISSYRNLVLVDCNEIKRTGLEKTALGSIGFARTAVVDHHESSLFFGDIRWVVPQVAAAGMLVYYIICAFDTPVTEPIASNLYTALVVDTGNFRYPNTSSEVLRVASVLAEAGADPCRINRAVNESWSEGRFRLFIKVLSTISIDGGVAITYATRKMFEETGTNADDTENFASFPLTMKDIRVAIFIREIGDDSYKLSLRSVEEVNVERVAASYGGGGHKNAAGCIAQSDLGTLKAELIKRLGSY